MICENRLQYNTKFKKNLNISLIKWIYINFFKFIYVSIPKYLVKKYLYKYTKIDININIFLYNERILYHGTFWYFDTQNIDFICYSVFSYYMNYSILLYDYFTFFRRIFYYPITDGEALLNGIITASPDEIMHY